MHQMEHSACMHARNDQLKFEGEDVARGNQKNGLNQINQRIMF